MISSIFRAGRAGGSFLAENPLGRIPVLITPGGERIINQWRFSPISWKPFRAGAGPGASARDRMWQHLAVMGTSLYPTCTGFILLLWS